MQFTTVQILNVTSGVLCSKMKDIYSLLGYMMGEDLHTLRLPPASNKCKPVLLALYPQFVKISEDVLQLSKSGNYSEAELQKLVKAFEAQHGSQFEVSPIQNQGDTFLDGALEDFVRKGGKVVNLNPSDPDAAQKAALEINYLTSDD